jgi:RNA polymerase subunit RPABC4/transcription elongation factor Spt4
MDFLKKHGEKILFLVLACGLALSVVSILKGQGDFKNAKPVQIQSNELELKTENVEKVLGLLSVQDNQVVISNDSFTAETRKLCVNQECGSLIPSDLKICPICGTEQMLEIDTDGDTITDTQEREWGMDPNDLTDVYLDQDEDGFFTLFEVQNGTNPTVASSHPPLIDYLRLEKLDQKSLQFELLGFSQLSNRVFTLQMRWAYPGQKWSATQYVKTGTRFGQNNEFQALRFVEKRTQQPDGRWKDESYASIQVGRHTINLGTDRNNNTGKVTESLAVLALGIGPEWEQEVRVGTSFELDKKTYNVIDILNDSVVIKADDTDSTRSVTRATPEEIEEWNPPKSKTQPEEGPMGNDPMMPVDFFPQF